MADVSVILAAHNAGRTIDSALESIHAQTVRDVEIVVIDDGSTDDTPSRLSNWSGRARCIRQDHRGEGHALNRGLELASADLVAFLDPADLWLPRKLERQVAQMRALEPAALSYTRSIPSRAPGRLLSEARDLLPLDRPGSSAARQFGAVFHDDAVRTSTVLIKRRVLEELGGFDERRDLRPFEAWDLWLRVAARFPIVCLPLDLAVHRPKVRSARECEQEFQARERVVERIASLYPLACERHPARPEACAADRLHRLQSDLARARFWRGDTQGARAAFKRAASLQGLDARDRALMAAARGGPLVFEIARRARDPWRQTTQEDAGSDRTSAFVQDTAYRRFRRTLTGAAHTLDDSLTRLTRRRLRVLFEAASPMSLAVFQPVFDRLVRDPRLEFWFTTCDHRWTAETIFHRVKEHGHIVPPAEVRWSKFDAYINTDFFNTTWPARRSRRIHLFHGVAGKYGLDAPTNIAPVVSTFDRLMFPNRDRLRRYAEAGLVDPDSPRAALIGYPKVDCLVDGSLDRAAIQSELALDPSRPTVLYAPTWSPYSSVARMGDRVVKALSALGVNVIVKLHDRSVEPNRGSIIDWRARLIAKAGGRVHVADGANASPYMLAADLLITDHSSVGFEFMLLDRPILVLDCPELIEGARINPEKVDLLRSAAEVVSSPDAIAPALERALLNPSSHSSRRRAIAEELFYCPGGASGRAAACIYQLLSLPALEEQHAPTPAEVRSRLPQSCEDILT